MSLLPNEVKTEHISTGAVTTPKLADEAVTARKLDENAVTTDKIALGAVTTSKLADKAVTGSKIRDGIIRSEKIAAGAITTSKIGEGQVSGSRLADRAVSTEKIANNAVTTSKIADRAVTAAKLSFTPPAIARPITPAVTTDEIANAAVTPEKLSFSVPTRPMTPPIATAEIGDGQVTQAKLAPGAGGDRHVFGTLLTPGLQSAEVLYLTGQAASIPWTVLDISTYVPEGAKAVLVQLGMFTESILPNSRAELRIRTNVDQRDALGVSNKGTSQSDYNGGVVPLVVTGARTLEYSMDVTGTISVTMWVTMVGYIV